MLISYRSTVMGRPRLQGIMLANTSLKETYVG